MRNSAVLTTVVMLLGSVHSATGQECPNVDPESGYPLSAVYVGEPHGGNDYLIRFIGAAAYRWRVPNPRGTRFLGSAREILLPPEPRWHDWQPEERHMAEMVVTVYRDGETRAAEPESASGDGRFDRTLASIVDDPMPGSPPLPDFPPRITTDSLTIRILFGTALGPATIRFAAHQTNPRRRSNFGRVDVPGPWSVTLKYDVTADGVVDAASIEVLRTTSQEAANAYVAALMSERFTPATSNCRPIAITQTSGRSRR